jgi:hypothetical protein
MKTPEFQTAVLGELQRQLTDDGVPLSHIRGAAQAALDLSEAYPDEVSDDGLHVFSRNYPECAIAVEHHNHKNGETV